MVGRRCNPYGYATDAGPKHLMGGMYGPEYAGHSNLVNLSGIHGLGVCERPATVRAVAVCDQGHRGPIMDLCLDHVAELQQRMLGTCTRCVWPDQARALNEQIESAMREAASARDRATSHRLQGRVADLAKGMDELAARGIIRARNPLRLVEIS